MAAQQTTTLEITITTTVMPGVTVETTTELVRDIPRTTTSVVSEVTTARRASEITTSETRRLTDEISTTQPVSTNLPRGG